MSRRKQSAPCKVEGDVQSGKDGLNALKSLAVSSGIKIGSSSPNGQIDAVDLGTNGLSCSTIIKSFLNTVYGKKSLLSTESDTKISQSPLSLVAIDNGSNSFLHPNDASVTRSGMVIDAEIFNDSDAFKTKQRFSARIRAKSLSTAKNADPKNQPDSFAELADDSAAIDEELSLQSAASLRYRTISGDEELTCHICYKTFKSKYGLLTHAAVHNTSEFKCVQCCIVFPNRSQLITHQMNMHADGINEMPADVLTQPSKSVSPKQPTEDVFHGFSDLSFIDFTCTKFPAIAAKWCERIKHQLSNNDCRHFFLCKKCNIILPTLPSLKAHVTCRHPNINSKPSLPFIKNSTLTTTQDKSLDNDGAQSEDPPTSPSQALSGQSPTTLNAMVVRPLYMRLLGLGSCAEESTARGSKSDDVVYGADDATIRTSAQVAYLNVPHWLRNSSKQICLNVGEEEYQPSTQPSDLSSLQCNICGEKFNAAEAVESHRASTMCGIGVRTSNNGRKMFWCRLCDYASFEKSTILRHQRTHTGIRPYACKFCRLAFTTKANCERHVRKRHAGIVNTETDVKDSVLCNHELLKKVRSGDLNFNQVSSKEPSPPRSQSYGFQCRMCKTAFSSRSNCVRHVMSRHGILNRKGANDMVAFVKINLPSQIADQVAAEQTGLWRNHAENNSATKIAPTSSMATPSRMALKRPHSDNSDDKSLPVKVPRLIPLSMIKAYNDAAEKLQRHFQNKYQSLLESIGLTDSERPVDLRRTSFTLLGLLASTCSLMMEERGGANNLPQAPSEEGTGRAHDVVAGGGGDRARAIESLKPRKILPRGHFDVKIRNAAAHPPRFTWKQRTLGFDAPEPATVKIPAQQELVQLFADGRISDSDNSNHFVQMENSERAQSESKFTPVRLAVSFDESEDAGVPSSSTSQPGQSDWTSVKQLVDFVQHSLPISVVAGDAQETAESSGGKEHNPVEGAAVQPRGTYKMIPIKPKPGETGTSNTHNNNSGLMWKFIPEHPKTRDASGRFVRDPEAASSQTASASANHMACLPDDDRPTMVSMNSASRVHFGGKSGVKGDHRGHFMLPRNRFKSRKCLKCDKVFPWASSLRRHIMTHTGLKPYMCGHCEMRFTTRSNLLRHANRRHGAIRDASELRRVLVTLTPRQQQEHAEKEAQKIADQSAAFREEPSPPTQQESNPQESSAEMTSRYGRTRRFKRPFKVATSQAPTRRFMCGLCAIPFANRSNVVRHLHRIHNICKDDPNFRELLVRMDVRPRPSTVDQTSSASTGVNVALGGRDERSTSSGPCVETIKADASQKYKPFQCRLCSIGFTKRNNAARHIQQQHHISRKKANFSQLILRVEPPAADEAPPVEEPPAAEMPPAPLDESPVVDTSSSDAQQSVEVKQELINEVSPSEEEPPVELSPNEAQSEDKEPSPEAAKPPEAKMPSELLGRGRRHSIRVKQEEEEARAPDPPPQDNDTQKVKMVPRNSKKFKSTHFVCGVCKRIFNDITELKGHLDTHNIPHPWHCPLCGVPFTNKYNCQRHLMRRHGASDVSPKYVEDLREYKGPKRKKSRYYR